MRRKQIAVVLVLGVWCGGGLAAQAGQPETKKPRDVLELPSPVKGILVHLMVKEGDKVQVGQVIGKIDDRAAELALRKAEAELAAGEAHQEALKAQHREAERRLERVKSLYQSKSVSQEEMDTARFMLAKVEAELHVSRPKLDALKTEVLAARLFLDKHQVRSPVSGVVLEILRLPGEAIQELGTLARIKMAR